MAVEVTKYDSKLILLLWAFGIALAPLLSYIIHSAFHLPSVIALLCMEMWIASLGIHLLGTVGLVMIKAPGKKVESPNREITTPISIVRPLCGDERGHLAENLVSLLDQDYVGEMETIFCLQSASDCALPIAERVKQDHPELNIRILVWEKPLGMNAKVNSIYKGYEIASYKWVFFVDSNVKVAKDYLSRAMTYSVQKDVGAISGATTGTEPTNFWSGMELCMLNVFIAKGMASTYLLGTTLMCGKSMLVNREKFDAAGGFKAFCDHWTEDIAMSVALRKHGYKVEVFHMPTIQPLYERGFREVWNRFLRWGTYRKSCTGLEHYVGEIMVYNKWTVGCFFAIAMYLLMGMNPLISFSAHIAFFFFLDFASVFLWYKDVISFSLLPAILFYDIMLLLLWIPIMMTTEVEWAGKIFAFDLNNKITKVCYKDYKGKEV
jgi:ceramide glucosyltransferase